jgi:hypothetical protein
MAAGMQVVVCRVVAPRRLVEVFRRFRGNCYLFHQRSLLEGAISSETSVSLHQTTRCYSPEDSHLHVSAGVRPNLNYAVWRTEVCRPDRFTFSDFNRPRKLSNRKAIYCTSCGSTVEMGTSVNPIFHHR